MLAYPFSGGRTAELTSSGPSPAGQSHAPPVHARPPPVDNRDLRIASFREQDPRVRVTGGGLYIGGNWEPGTGAARPAAGA